MKDRTAVAVTFTKELNRMTAVEFWEDCGGFEGMDQETEKNWELLCEKYGISTSRIPPRSLLLKRAETELADMERHHIRYTCYGMTSYPPLLAECPDAPLILFYKGELDHSLPALSIVGTRKASTACKEKVEDIITVLKREYEPLIIVSGLAYGIDITAHRSALENGLTTYAVMGDGLDRVYPAAHRETADEIVRAGGALISEFYCNYPINRSNFLQRNRIIAGLSLGTLVAESKVKGGSMVTAKQAFSYSRELMAVPGRPEDENSRGCNQLIKQDCAALVEDAHDIASRINLEKIREKTREEEYFSSPSKNIYEEMIYNLLAKENRPVNIEELVVLSGLDCSTLNSTLSQMELKEMVRSYPGNNYKIKKNT